jgi:hypothetical protein
VKSKVIPPERVGGSWSESALCNDEFDSEPLVGVVESSSEASSADSPSYRKDFEGETELLLKDVRGIRGVVGVSKWSGEDWPRGLRSSSRCGSMGVKRVRTLPLNGLIE